MSLPEPSAAPQPQLPSGSPVVAHGLSRRSLPLAAPASSILSERHAGLGTVMVAPTHVPGLDRLLGGGLHLLRRGGESACGSTFIGISGAPGTGRTTLAMSLAAALCRAYGRGACLYLCLPEAREEVRALSAALVDGGFAWTHLGLDQPPPAVAAGLIIDGLPREEGGGPLGPVGRLIDRARALLPRETPLRVVVLDAGEAARLGPEGVDRLQEALCEPGISLIGVGVGPQSGREDLALALAPHDDRVGGRALTITRSRLVPSFPGPHMLAFLDGGLLAMPMPSLYPALSRPPDPALRALPPGLFGDSTLDERAQHQPWITPQCRVLLYGPDPTCTLLLANRFLKAARERLAVFFSAPAARAPESEPERGMTFVPRAESGAEMVARFRLAMEHFQRRWPRQLAEAPRVALIEPLGLHADGRHDTSPPVLDAALLSVASELGATALIVRVCRELPAHFCDFDLVLNLPQRVRGSSLLVRVVTDRVTRP